MVAKQGWFDRTLATVAPRMYLRRVRARIAADLVTRSFDGASTGRRTQGWRRTSSDGNAATAPFVGRLRDIARDLVRNNPYAESALTTICDHAVGWGIIAKAKGNNARAQAAWDAWAGSTACDADGRHDFAGLQKLVMRTVAESGEVLVRRRLRRLEDGLPIPLQIQVLEPDYLDTSKHGVALAGGGRIVYGIEFDGIGRRVAYWLFPEHPGNAAFTSTTASQRVPASGVVHVFKGSRPGAYRGSSWFAPVLLRFKDFDDFEDATLMKQKVAACLAVVYSDVNGDASPLGDADDTQSPPVDMLQPGALIQGPPGQNIQVIQPPTTRDYGDYCSVTLRSIATGIGVTYEDLTGNYTDLPFSAARMSRIRHWARVEDWRWRMLIPQFCNPVWVWAMEAAAIMGIGDAPGADWTAPPMPMVEPDKEGLAYQRNIRTGITTLSEAIRERGYDPKAVFAEMAADNKEIDRLGLVLDSDARKTSQAGQVQSVGNSAGTKTEMVDDNKGATDEPEA